MSGRAEGGPGEELEREELKRELETEVEEQGEDMRDMKGLKGEMWLEGRRR